MEALFFICAFLVLYPYAVYPALLVAINRLLGRELRTPAGGYEPAVSIIMPVHNEASRVTEKIRNLLDLDYPADRLELFVVGDGCTDHTLDLARKAGGDRVKVLSLPQRSGKAAGLNEGLRCATGEIVVFTDVGIRLERASLRRIVSHFADERVGCVSGEDYVEGAETEGLYGRLELALRREEAKLHSIAGASGCFYAQRSSLCEPFVAGMAPDFLSVLVTVRSGHRALADPASRGSMTATTNQRAEFKRKVRTFLRGLTALLGNADLLNPIRYPAFSFTLWSHKLLRWLAPLSLIGCLVASWWLREHLFYLVMLGLQAVFYSLAITGLIWPKLTRSVFVRLPTFFLMVNAAALEALVLWMVGSRAEIWQPTQRPA